MSTDPNSKTIRQFRCRDYLWETFEEMGRELGCSPDYLVNEAMRLYARSREYGTENPSIAPQAPGASREVTDRAPKRASAASGINPAAARSSYMPPPPTIASGPGARRAPATTTSFDRGQVPIPSVAPRNAALETISGARTAPADLNAPRVTRPRPASAAAPQPSARPRQAPAAPPAPPVASAGAVSQRAPKLTMIFGNDRIAIDKPEFVIGRGSKSSDFAIKDGNISRRHCAVVWENGNYWLRDLGSTNGVEYDGVRIEQRRIDEGDVFHLCDYEVRFTYR